MAARMGFVPYIMPGFALAKAAAEVYEPNPDVEGLILHKHGIFTFGENAREAYERMIAHGVAAPRRGSPRAAATCSQPRELPTDLAVGRRGRADHPRRGRGAACGEARRRAEALRARLPHRPGDPRLRQRRRACATTASAAWSRRTTSSAPRTRRWSAGAGGRQARRLRARGASSQSPTSPRDYDAYFARENARVGGIKTKLDPVPRVVLVPGSACSASAARAKDAAIAADIAENTVRVVTDAEGDRPLRAAARERSVRDRILVAGAGQAEGRRGKPLTGQVAVVTGAGAASARATAKALRRRGRRGRRRSTSTAAAAKAAAKRSARPSGSPAT